MTTERRKQDLQVLTERFFRLHHLTDEMSSSEVIGSLIGLGLKVVPAYWRNYRCALKFYAREICDEQLLSKLEFVFNPTTVALDDARLDEQRKKVIVTYFKGRHPPKQNRCKKVTEADHYKILLHFAAHPDPGLEGAVMLAYLTGMRPAEMETVCVQDKYNAIFIITAKQTEDGRRGLSRFLQFSDEEFAIIKQSLVDVANEKYRKDKSGKECDPNLSMNRIQNRLGNLTKKVFPRRKHHISLYSYRHQMGSNLKASGFDAVSIAAIMGHQSVDSIDVYGNARSATRRLEINISKKTKEAVRMREKTGLAPLVSEKEEEESENANKANQSGPS